MSIFKKESELLTVLVNRCDVFSNGYVTKDIVLLDIVEFASVWVASLVWRKPRAFTYHIRSTLVYHRRQFTCQMHYIYPEMKRCLRYTHPKQSCGGFCLCSNFSSIFKSITSIAILNISSTSRSNFSPATSPCKFSWKNHLSCRPKIGRFEDSTSLPEASLPRKAYF